MDDSLRSPTPVSAAGGFAGRSPGPRHEPRAAIAASPEPESTRAPDRIDVDRAVAVARRVLRERVLARTRRRLELDDALHVPEFAEAIDAEPVGAFLGRLLSAQNQLAAQRLPAWGTTRVRRELDTALRDGVAETFELLAGAPGPAGAGDDGAAVVADVLAEYGRRLAALTTAELAPATPPEAPAAPPGRPSAG